MSAEANKAITRKLFEEVLNTGRFAALDELFAPSYRNYFPGSPAPLNRTGWEHTITLFRSAFPDMQCTIEQLIAEGDTVATWFTFRGTHQGDFQGIAPTGKQVAIPCHAFFHLADGKIVEDRPIFDRLELFHQLGASPLPGQGQP